MPKLFSKLSCAALLACASASAQTYLSASLTTTQENPPTNPTLSTGGARPVPFGTASFVINAAQTSMTFTATIYNLDVTGLQTKDTNDDLTAAHIHASATVTPTTNGGVVWGFFGNPFNDNNPNDNLVVPFVITPFSGTPGGTFSGKWDPPEGNGTTFAAQLTNILSGHAYINFHTKQYGGGEIRGNITLAPAITSSAALPPGKVGTAYSQTLAANGGTTPYVWSVASGTLPAGLTLSSDGVLSGTPTAVGTSNFTATVTGSPASFTSQAFSLTILPAQPLSFTNAVRVAQVVDANGFFTQFAITNLDQSPVSFQFRFWSDTGTAVNFPIQNGTPGSIVGVLQPGATAFAQTAGTSAPAAQGWAEIASTGRISVQANYFRSGIPDGADSEAAVIGSQSGNNILMPFDNTQGFVTGVAIANGNAIQSIIVTITAIPENGGTGASTTVQLAPHGHAAIVLPTALPATANARGTVKFTGGSGTDVSAIGLRFGPRNSISSFGSGQQ